MLSALISSAGRKPAMLLAEQLAHESCVRPGPLVLGTALLKSPTPTEDRDRHDCYRRRFCEASGASSFLTGSACRHAGRTISSLARPRSSGVRHMVSEDSGCIRSVRSPVPTSSIHGDGLRGQREEPFGSEMDSLIHCPHNAGEGQEVLLLRAQEGLRFEEGDDLRQQVFPFANNEHQ